MEANVKKLHLKLMAALDSHAAEENPVRRQERCVSLTQEIIGELRELLAGHTFRNKADEIKYFKVLAPPFYCQHIYHTKLLNRELHRLTGGKERQLGFLDKELEAIDQFFVANAQFIHYCYMEGRWVDEQLFTRQGTSGLILDELEAVMDQTICVASYKLARVHASELYRHYLETEIRIIREPASLPLPELAGKKFEFEGTNADVTEWITAFVRQKVIRIDGVPADMKTLARICEVLFHRKLGNVYDTQHSNAQRKKDPTPFLNGLIRAVIKKENGPR